MAYYLISSSGDVVSAFGDGENALPASAAARLAALALSALCGTTTHSSSSSIRPDTDSTPEIVDLYLAEVAVCAGYMSSVGLIVMGIAEEVAVSSSSSSTCSLSNMRVNVYHLCYLLTAMHTPGLQSVSSRLKASSAPLLARIQQPATILEAQLITVMPTG